MSAATLVPCFVCGKKLERVHGEEMQAFGAVYCTTSGGYGSRLIDGKRVAFLICDDCISDSLLRTRLVKETRVTNTWYEQWPDDVGPVAA